jgi:hypothetical protein
MNGELIRKKMAQSEPDAGNSDRSPQMEWFKMNSVVGVSPNVNHYFGISKK